VVGASGAIQKIVDAKDAKIVGLILEIYQLIGLANTFQSLLIWFVDLALF